MADVRVGLAELLTVKNWTRLEELLLLYHAAESRGQANLTISEVKDLFDEARSRPGNVHRDLAVLEDRGLLLRDGKGWRLSQRGFIAAEKQLTDAGLLSDTPERSSVEPLRRVSANLRAQASRISNRELRSFVEEALRCLDPSIAALRAAVVLGWAGGVARLKERAWAFGPEDINRVLTRLSWKNRVALEQDLDDLRESQLLIVAHELGVFDKSALKLLTADLDVRNACAHPTDVSVGTHRVEAFLEEVIDLLYQ